MKLDRVFVAFLKSDGKEHLLYKKEDNLYYDLNTKEKYTSNDIDLGTLIYLKDSIYTLFDNMLKYNIKKLYNSDRAKLLDVNYLVIAKLNKVYDLEKIALSGGYTQYKWNARNLNNTILTRYLPGVYRDIRNDKMYIGENADLFVNGSIYVADAKNSDIKYLRDMYYGSISIPKKKVLELAYKVSKGKEI